MRVRPARGYFGSGQATVPGRLVLDGMDLVRGAFLRFDDYSLGGVARAVLGEGKVALGEADGNRGEAILARYREDLPTFAPYARADARLAATAVALRDGTLDDKLVYHKGLRKPPADYTANTPPHVAAARKSGHRGGVIAYLVTVAGPEPVDALTSELDREHYLDKQVRPVAEPVLGALDLDFDRVVGDDRQDRLF